MSATACHVGPACPVSTPARRPALLSRLATFLARTAALGRQRRRLAGLGPRDLRDIGVTAAQARTEAARPAWDAPAHWIGGDGA